MAKKKTRPAVEAVFTFNLETQEGKDAHARASHAADMAGVLWDFDQYLRGEAKYNGDEAAAKFRDKLWEMMREHSIDLDELLS